jgi:hypothetical protein
MKNEQTSFRQSGILDKDERLWAQVRHLIKEELDPCADADKKTQSLERIIYGTPEFSFINGELIPVVKKFRLSADFLNEEEAAIFIEEIEP